MPELYNTTNPNGGLPLDVLRTLQDLGKPSSSAVPLARTETSTPAPGAPISENAKTLCRTLEKEMNKLSGEQARLGTRDTLLAGLRQSLRKLSGNVSTRRESAHQGYAELHDTLERHRGPVLVLTPNGLPQYLFEWKNDGWNGYYASPPFDRLAEQVAPAQMLQQLFLQSSNGMCFSTYRVAGWKHAAQDLGADDDLLVLQPEHKRSDGSDTAAILRRRGSSSSSTASLDDALGNHLPSEDVVETRAAETEKGRYA